MSPRSKKPRHCRCSFRGKAFKPTGDAGKAGAGMGVSRGTIQRILSVARKKVAMALSKGKAIVFE